jgi:hypothetical protein
MFLSIHETKPLGLNFSDFFAAAAHF